MPSFYVILQVCKNRNELVGMIAAHQRDGAAMCIALAELELLMQAGQPVKLRRRDAIDKTRSMLQSMKLKHVKTSP